MFENGTVHGFIRYRRNITVNTRIIAGDIMVSKTGKIYYVKGSQSNVRYLWNMQIKHFKSKKR